MLTIAVVVCCGLMLIGVEHCAPGRSFPRVARWLPRALVLTLFQGIVAFVAASTWDRWMAGATAWHVGGNSVALDALLGYFVLTFIYYWWHRARHEVPFLWRWFHRVHHSATRIEVLTSFYKHPLEILANGLLSSSILYLLLGLEPAAAGFVVMTTGLAELFYHWNVRTPYWLGFFVQRPESHCIHHQRGHHTDNFSDLPLWDMLFGTFRNPRKVEADCGFGVAREIELGSLLLGRGHE